jgi:glycosyltransferase involved in cell wall biosynthesis
MIAVSLLIPAYKRIQQTLKTLECVFASQGIGTEFMLEVIVIDDSPDTSLTDALKNRFADRLQIVRPSINGIASAKNYGAKIAKHPIIIFSDSDIELQIDTLRNTLNYLKTHEKAAMVGGNVRWKDGADDGKLDRPRVEDRIKEVDGTHYIEALYSRFVATYKSVFWQAGGYDEQLFNMRGEGSDLSIRYWRNGFPLTFNPDITVFHVEEATDAVTRQIQKPEQGIVRDLVQLLYLYNNSRDESPNFSKTLQWLTDRFGSWDKYVILEDVVNLLPYFCEQKQKLDEKRTQLPQTYHFSFLDVFTKVAEFQDCLEKASERLKQARDEAFKTI